MASDTEKNIYLSGGGGERASFLLDRLFFSSIPTHGKVLYIPAALRGHALFEGAEAWLKGVMKIHDRHVDIILETWRELEGQNFSDLNRYSAIYVGGGNTWNLIKEITESGFRDALAEYIRSGGLYYGGSAGAIVCGARIDTQQDENRTGWKDVSGMDVLGGLSIACHVKNDQLDSLKAIAAEKRLHLLALPEDAGVVFGGNSYRCVGEGACSEFPSKD